VHLAAPSGIREGHAPQHDYPRTQALESLALARVPLAGTHFRRQVSIGPYIADFCSYGAKLIVEVDGNQHGTDGAREQDAVRTAFMQTQGYRVLRFSNRDVMLHIDMVLDTIAASLAPTPFPSPRGRGESKGNHG
jgi:very-short-patch-repair endonuclease